jgi:methyl-accepting chemotaxis protein
VTDVVKKAKVPIVAGGAALAGLAGAAVVSARSARRRTVLGIPMPKRSRLSLPNLSGISVPGRNGFKTDARQVTGAITDAAKRADQLGQRVSQVASSVQKVSETANEAVKKS